jgi:uncharacterized protein YifE (UPF0438 family)
MSDKRKRGRKVPETLEQRVLREYARIKRYPWGWDRSGGKTVHMQLAEKFSIPCQQVLDIIDPDRQTQKRRIERFIDRKRNQRRHEQYMEANQRHYEERKIAEANAQRGPHA